MGLVYEVSIWENYEDNHYHYKIIYVGDSLMVAIYNMIKLKSSGGYGMRLVCRNV